MNLNALELLTLGCYGKLPISREFIVEDSRSLAASGFDRWVSEGVGMVKARLGSASDQRITTFPRYRFYWSDGDRALTGLVSPSQDQAGRKHPFALFASLRGRVDSAAAAALQAWSLQEQLAARWDDLVAVESAAALRGAVRAAHGEISTADRGVLDLYRTFLADTRGDQFWTGMRGAEAGDIRFTVMQALLETVGPLARNEARAFRGGVRFPLNGGAASQSALESCFWLDLTERCLRRRLENHFFLRSPCEDDAGNDHLYQFLSPPSANHWISLVDAQSDLESISYLDRPYGSEPAMARMTPDLRALLESDAASLGDYIAWAAGS